MAREDQISCDISCCGSVETKSVQESFDGRKTLVQKLTVEGDVLEFEGLVEQTVASAAIRILDSNVTRY